MTSMLDFKAQAFVIEEVGGPFKLVDIDIRPENLSDDEVLVRFQASGICHTDLGSWSGKIPAPFPCILGHEGAGEVIAVGKNFQSNFSKGDSVLASFCSCGNCNSCLRIEPACCDLFLPLNLGFFDHSMKPITLPYNVEKDQNKQAFTKYFGQSSFANVMPVSGRSLTKISKAIPPKFASGLACGFQTGFSTVMEKAQSRNVKGKRSFDIYSKLDKDFILPNPSEFNQEEEDSFDGETLLVTGIGAVGIGALMAGKMLKFGKVIACDLIDSRLQLAKDEIGVDEVINPKDFKTTEEFVDCIRSKSKDGRGATLVIEASGSPKAMKDGVMSLAIKGKAIIVGSPPSSAILEVPLGLILANVWTIEGVLMGNSNPSVTIPFLIELFKKGKLNVLNSMVRTYKPEHMEQAVSDAEKGYVIKTVIEWC